jgi:hypothetical protein
LVNGTFTDANSANNWEECPDKEKGRAIGLLAGSKEQTFRRGDVTLLIQTEDLETLGDGVQTLRVQSIIHAIFMCCVMCCIKGAFNKQSILAHNQGKAATRSTMQSKTRMWACLCGDDTSSDLVGDHFQAVAELLHKYTKFMQNNSLVASDFFVAMMLVGQEQKHPHIAIHAPLRQRFGAGGTHRAQGLWQHALTSLRASRDTQAPDENSTLRPVVADADSANRAVGTLALPISHQKSAQQYTEAATLRCGAVRLAALDPAAGGYSPAAPNTYDHRNFATGAEQRRDALSSPTPRASRERARTRPFGMAASEDFEETEETEGHTADTRGVQLDLSEHSDRVRIQNLDYYFQYAMGIYGWPLYAYRNISCAPCRLVAVSPCCQPVCPRHKSSRAHGAVGTSGDCCGCNISSEIKTTDENGRGTERFRVFSNFNNTLSDKPFSVTIDRVKRSIVISIRGTLSLKDIMTDLVCTDVRFPVSSDHPFTSEVYALLLDNGSLFVDGSYEHQAVRKMLRRRRQREADLQAAAEGGASPSSSPRLHTTATPRSVQAATACCVPTIGGNFPLSESLVSVYFMEVLYVGCRGERMRIRSCPLQGRPRAAPRGSSSRRPRTHCPGPPGRLSALRVFLCKSVLYGVFVWARRALNSQKRRFPAWAAWSRCGRSTRRGARARPSSGWPSRSGRTRAAAKVGPSGSCVGTGLTPRRPRWPAWAWGWVNRLRMGSPSISPVRPGSTRSPMR